MTPLLSVATTLLAVRGVPPAAAGGALINLPWHLADVCQMVRNETDLESLSVELNLLDDVPQGYRLFIVPLSAFTQRYHFRRTEELCLYVGQQGVTQAVQRRVFPTSDHHMHKPAGFNFTRWGDMERASIRPARDGLYEHGSYEGVFARASVLYPWKKGRYTYRLVREEVEITPAGWFTWAGASVTVHNTGETVHVGSLRFPGLCIRLGRQFGSFVEVFGSAHETPQSIPPIRLTVGNWQLNGAELPIIMTVRTYPRGVPQVAEVKPIKQFLADGECADSADLPRGNDAVGIVIRPKPIQRRPERTVIWSVARPGWRIPPLEDAPAPGPPGGGPGR